MFAHAKQGMWESSALVWTLDGERVRGEVPDAARGIGFANPAPFLEVLLPRLDRTQRVLDVGGGDGRIAHQVAPHVREIVCSDVSPTMVAEATQNLVKFSNASTFLARGYTLRPLRDESFDVAFAQGVLSFIEVNLGLALLDEMHRVLRPGGTLVVNAFTFDRPEWARDQLEAVRESRSSRPFHGGFVPFLCGSPDRGDGSGRRLRDRRSSVRAGPGPRPVAVHRRRHALRLAVSGPLLCRVKPGAAAGTRRCACRRVPRPRRRTRVDRPP
jgi:SAM-dependent methyltransferase